MLKKAVTVAVLSCTFGFSASLTELLQSVQSELTRYEQQGLALEDLYTYTKLKEYYRYGKLYASYAFEEPAVELLSLASCTVAPYDCSPHKYLLRNLTEKSFERYRREIPLVLAKLETSYNAYAEWWIRKNFSRDKFYEEYKNLEGVIRKDFYDRWRDFLTVAPKPVIFYFSRRFGPPDFFALKALKFAYERGWLKQLCFYGDRGDFIFLIQKGYLPKDAKFVYFDKDKNYEFICAY